ncbi:MAG: phosphomannomutase/phosphoglucomutase [Patescibacteria group bacterium]|nr:phosphomannomutase/phosphoglucomutase [Patescibacteria group bacterium]
MPKINEKIFKSYDIRGTYPDQLNEEIAYLIGRAFACRSKAEEVTLGHDMRLSGPALKKALIKGIIDEGVNVKDIGLMPIDAVYASVGIFGDQAGIMITASHNPSEYNGFKMVLKDMKWIRGEELLEDVKNLPEQTAKNKGQVRQEDIMDKYINHVMSFVDKDKIKPFKVVVDAGNGLAGRIIPELEKELPIKVRPLNFKLDGNFPAHPSNPLMPESQKQITEAVKKEEADFGAIFDGDTDRLFFVDEKGNFIAADITLLILAKFFLEKEKGAGIVYNLICSRSVPEYIKKWGGRPIRAKTGYVNISKKMREEKGIMGGELSAHYSFRRNAFADSGFISFLILLEVLSKHNQPLSEIIKPFAKYVKSPETNVEIENAEEIINKIKEKYQDGRQDDLDGITVEYKDWWFNVRPSNTEPLLRITVEADTKEIMEEKREELVNFIKQNK